MELSTVFYYQDRAVRDYHFSKLDAEARKVLAEPPEPGKMTAEQAVSQAAYIAFMAEYDMPHLQPRVPPAAAREFLAEHKAGRIPAWALKAVKLKELRASARGR
ncbi:hypothetical protein [Deinococcus gobiensis]|uniref:Uncharacterized protein n=1 Tax=Deinococcus gobiensis (strain DSM 21396 / JCM 16679 / CGMCC 1.7299 / I-0) TaxID=745776 RepID=H8GX98_DEIGI|nr:hypothetical protein [Deinococcus gobiensis]AFD25827.1 hypothetical protein DGo_CA1900 [Deinococcus gobiensis I-0]